MGASTIYRDRNNKIIATMRSSFQLKIKLPTYTFHDLTHNSTEGVSKDKGGYFVHYKDASTGLKTKRIDASDQELFAGQGWHYFLTQNLNRPERIPKSLKLALPSRLSTYTLQVRKVAETANTVEYHLVFANPIIRLLAPRIEAIYDKRTRKMLRYRGPSNILDENEELQSVVIQYK